MNNQTFDPYAFEQKEIDGVPVYHKSIPTAPCIYIQYIVNTGSYSDPEDRQGLAHFLEHMIFDGSPSLPSKKEVSNWSKKYALGSCNAYTSNTHTVYHLKCLPEHFDTVLSTMTEMVFRPLLKIEDVENERSVITQEFWRRYKNPKFFSYTKESYANTFYNTKSEKKFTILGYPDTIKAITQNDLSTYHKNHYGKGNITMVIAGNVDETHLQKIEKVLADIPQVSKNTVDFGTLGKPKELKIVKTCEEIGDEREQVTVSFERAIHKKRMLYGTKNIAQSLLQDILFEKLREEKGLCYRISVAYSTAFYFYGWGVSLLTSAEHIDTVISEFNTTLQEIYDGKWKDKFEIVKQMGTERIISSEHVTADMITDAVNDLRAENEIIPQAKLLEERAQVTYDDVVTCLKEAFDPEWTVTEIILPTEKK